MMWWSRRRRPVSLRKFFSVFTIVFLAVMGFLGGLTVHRIQRILEVQEETFQRQLAERIESFLEQRARTARLLIRYLYADAFYLEEIGRLLDEGYPSYLEFTLRTFADEGGFAVRSIERYFALYRDIHPDIAGIVLSDMSGAYAYRFDTAGTRIARPHEITDRIDYVARNDGALLVPARSVGSVDGESRAFAFVLDLPDPVTGESMGRLFVDFSVRSIEDTYREYISDLNSTIFVLNQSGDLVFDGTGRYDAAVVASLRSETARQGGEASRSYRIVRNGNIVIGVPVPEFGATIVTRIDRAAVAGEATPLTATISTFLVLTLILATVVLWNVRNRIEGEVRSILDGLRRIEGGDFIVRLPAFQSREFDQVARGVEGMGRQLSEYIRRAFLYQLEERNAELNFLQEQVNPHFLYNALESIRMRAVADGSEDAADMLYALGALFRRMVKDNRVVVTVREELEFAKEYMKLFAVRHRDRLSFETEISGRAAELAVPKLVLQPLVENYIMHGFSPRRSDNRLNFRGMVRDTHLVIELADNGRGVPADRRDAIKRQLNSESGGATPTTERSVGLLNVQRRLALAFPDDAWLDFDATEHHGATVRLTVPAMRVEDMQSHVQGTDS